MVRRLSVCKVWDGDYPWDVRAEKIASALTEAGHRVALLARNRSRRPIVEELPEATVFRLPPWRWAPASLDGACMFPAFPNPRWLWGIERVARLAKAAVILCRDLPLAPACIFVARKLGLRVVLDMAENYPAMLRSRRATGRSRSLDFLIRNPTLARRVERWALRRVDGVLVVVDESRDRLIADGVPAGKLAIVGNTPPLARLAGAAARHEPSNPLRAVYLGLIEAQRGIGTMLDAIAVLKAQGFPVRLTIYGDGLDGELFRRHAEALGLGPTDVVFRGYVPNDLALAELPDAHVGIVPHWKDESWDTTIPNKIFDYMAAGLAVITSDAGPAARIVRATNGGRIYRDRNAADLAAALRALADPLARREAGLNGRAAIRDTYHWEQDVSRMLALLDAVTR